MAQNKILYSAKLDENMRRSAYFKTNKRTVKSNIMLKFVMKAMDIKLRGEAGFTTTLEDPIELLKCTEQFMKKSADAEYDFLDFWEANQKFFAMKQGTTENLMHFKERFLRQAEVLQDLYGVAWFRNFAVKTKAYAAIASTNTAAQNKFKDDIFEAVLATGFLCNCDQTRTAPLMKAQRSRLQKAKADDEFRLASAEVGALGHAVAMQLTTTRNSQATKL
ncbi:unnamed protein product [Cylindrotheca closterium]|uniref:Uncharacterized protein n=1 Tax=Cylindrotheca closterium TaxID=2856 RepID=A0AAD2JIA4_9STRA|nr:unnamed protein product [Cylindrotheca closterium]